MLENSKTKETNNKEKQKDGGKNIQIHHVCQFLWCKYYHHARF